MKLSTNWLLWWSTLAISSFLLAFNPFEYILTRLNISGKYSTLTETSWANCQLDVWKHCLESQSWGNSRTPMDQAVSSHIVFVQILGTFSTFACKTINAGYNLHLCDAQIPQLEDCTRFWKKNILLTLGFETMTVQLGSFSQAMTFLTGICISILVLYCFPVEVLVKNKRVKFSA